MDRRFEQVDKRFEQVDKRFGQVNDQFKYFREEMKEDWNFSNQTRSENLSINGDKKSTQF